MSIAVDPEGHGAPPQSQPPDGPEGSMPADSGEPELTDPSAARQQRLIKGVAGLRVRRGAVPLERILLIAGSVMLPLGALLILLGWYGAAHTPKLFEQIDYLISGGLLGVAFVAAGGFFYFGYWLTRQVYDARAQNDRLVASLDRIEARLAEQPGADARGAERVVERVAVKERTPVGNGRSRPLRRQSPNESPSDPARPLLVATANGSMLHRPDCAVVAGRDGLRRLPFDEAGYKLCRICDPLGSN